jgi:glutaredoxin
MPPVPTNGRHYHSIFNYYYYTLTLNHMKLTIYSKSDCPYCLKIKQVGEYLVNEKNYSIAIYELGTDFTKEQFYKEFGVGSTFPQVILNEHHLGGCSDTVKYLQENKIL